MKGFAVSLIVAAFAIAIGSSTEETAGETPPRFLLELKNNEGSNVGKLEYRMQSDYAAFIYGALPGLEPGIYSGIFQDDRNFTGTCASSDPLKENLPGPTFVTYGSSRFNITAPFYSVRSYVQGFFLGCNRDNYAHGGAIYLYSRPSDVDINEYLTAKPHPSPVACGYLRLRAPCH